MLNHLFHNLSQYRIRIGSQSITCYPASGIPTEELPGYHIQDGTICKSTGADCFTTSEPVRQAEMQRLQDTSTKP